MDGNERADTRIARTLHVEADLVRGAIDLVASGGSDRVTVAGLRFGEELLERARRQARERGVRVVPSWSIDEGGMLDLVIERGSEPDAR
jgi:arginase family enzyme